MTAVCARRRPWGVEIGADSCVTYGELTEMLWTPKITRTSWGAIGICGGESSALALERAAECGRFNDAVTAVYGIRHCTSLLTDGQQIVCVSGRDATLGRELVAIGSGAEVCLGALAAGVGVLRALQIASKHCAGVGGALAVYRIRHGG